MTKSGLADAARKVFETVKAAVAEPVDGDYEAAPRSIYDELESDHKEVKALLSELTALSPRAAKTRTRVFTELKLKLTAHARAEEKIFYGAMMKDKDARVGAREGFEEHHLVDVLLAEMTKLSAADERWTAKLSVLKENVEHHIDEEEGEFFAKARDVLDSEEADRLGAKFAAEKEKRLAKAT